MFSEDVRKIIALIVVTLSYVSLPVLFFLLIIAVYLNLYYTVQFYYTRAAADAIIAILLAFVNIALFFCIRALIRWLRK